MKVIPFPLQGIQCITYLISSVDENSGVEYTCLALWMRMWITDSFAEMGWLEL